MSETCQLLMDIRVGFHCMNYNDEEIDKGAILT